MRIVVALALLASLDPVDAFGEEGAAPSVPGPLLRAKVGTRVEATIRNALSETLVVSGLRER